MRRTNCGEQGEDNKKRRRKTGRQSTLFLHENDKEDEERIKLRRKK